MKQSGIDMFGHWLNNQQWKEVFEAKTVDEKTEIFQKMLMDKIDESPSEEMKILKRQKSREFNKNRCSLKWRDLNENYKKLLSLLKDFTTKT